MLLGQLKSKIRTTKGNPLLRIELAHGALGTVALLKAPLLEALDTMYPDGKTTETGLVFEMVGDNAMIRPENSTEPYRPAPLLDIMESAQPPKRQIIDLLDLDDAPKLSATLLDF